MNQIVADLALKTPKHQIIIKQMKPVLIISPVLPSYLLLHSNYFLFSCKIGAFIFTL